jgi:hypothetical protein
MKTRKPENLLAAAAIALVLSACSETINNVDDTIAYASVEKSTVLTTDPVDYCDFTAELSEAEIAGLMEMREEEKLAHDVYMYFYDSFNHVVFKNIAASEAQHTSSVLRLIEGYGLEDPALAEVGEFNDQKFIDLYAILITAGDLTEGLKAGALIEETDIADLKIHIEETEVTTLQTVYSHLLSASKIHLKAFTRVLTKMGVTYIPTILSEEEYQEIIEGLNTNIEGETTTWPGVCDGTGPNA